MRARIEPRRSTAAASPMQRAGHARGSGAQAASQLARDGRRRAAVARLRELRHVPRLRASRRRLRRGGDVRWPQEPWHADALQPRAPRVRAYDPRPASGRRCCSRRIGLVMVYSASIAMAEAERFTGIPPDLFPGAPRDLSSRRVRVAAALVSRAPAAVAEGVAVALHARRRRLLVAGADPRRRPRGERRAALALLWIRNVPALGADEALRRALRRGLHGAQGRVHGRACKQGLPADVRRDDVRRGAAAARARLRRVRGGDDDRDGACSSSAA